MDNSEKFLKSTSSISLLESLKYVPAIYNFYIYMSVNGGIGTDYQHYFKGKLTVGCRVVSTSTDPMLVNPVFTYIAEESTVPE